MNARCVFLMVLGAVLLVSVQNECHAQRGRRGFGGRGGFSSPLSLVNVAAVQKDLELSEDQTKKVASLSEEMRNESDTMLREAAEGLGDVQSLSEEERRSKMGAAMADASKKLNEKFAPKLTEILEPKQSERLKQISWQAAGPRAYADPEVVKGLGLSKEQQEKLASLGQESEKQLRELGRDGGFEKVRELRDQLATQSDEVLSQEQQDKFKEMKGKPFDTASLYGGGRGGRGFGRRGGNTEPGTEEKKPE